MRVPRAISSTPILIAAVLAIHPAYLHAQSASALPAAQVGAGYKFELKAQGGKPPFKWSLVKGALPPGIELSDDGIIHGVPSVASESPVVFTVKVSDASNPPLERVTRFSLSVSAAPEQTDLRILLPSEPSTPKVNVLNPATFIRILEDPKTGHRQVVYDPSNQGLARHLQGTADERSTIVILPVAKLIDPDVALNKLYITAKLASGDSSKDIPVLGYSEIGKDKATMASQTATAFQSASNIKNMVLDMSFTVNDILGHVYVSCRQGETNAQPADKNKSLAFDEWKSSHDIDLKGACAKDIDDKIAKAARNADPNAHPFQTLELQPLIERLRLYQPEIQNIAEFFSNKQNLTIVEKIGTEVFWIDRNSLESIAQQYKDSVQTVFDATTSEQKKAQILKDLLERTKLIYQDFGDLRQQIMSTMCPAETCGPSRSKDEWEQLYQKTILIVAGRQQRKAFEELTRLLAPGIISLTENKAKDGDRLTITVETLPSDATSGGIQAVFEITVKKYGVKVGVGSSLLFIRRLGVTDAEATPPTGSTVAPINRVNFAPSPGVTFGMAFFKRGNTTADKFLRGLAPGAGVNVSFMNFNDPSFDLATGKFVNTNGTNVQVGSGIIGSVFDNKVQVSYGWNLNVERRRTYFGVGFDFIRAGEEIAKLFK